MFFKIIDKSFDRIRYFLSLITFIFITLSILFFIYWLIYSANIPLPEWFTAFFWAIIDFFAFSIKQTPLYKELMPVLPVLTCGVFIILTYFLNCLMLFLSNYHKSYLKKVENYKRNLENTINKTLHNDFLNELRQTRYLLAKIKISAIKQESYLLDTDDIDISKIENSIQQQILNSIDCMFIEKKGLSNNSVYFLLTDFNNAQTFFTTLINKSTEFIVAQINQKLKISFSCCVDVFNDISQLQEASDSIDKIFKLKIINKITVTPRFKVYYDNLRPEDYHFTLVGEYNISDDSSVIKNMMIYSIVRKEN